MNLQVNNALQYIFFFLLIFAGIVISQQNAVQSGHVESSLFDSMTFCQQISDGNISNQSKDVAPFFDDALKTNAKDTQSKTITSCHSLANMLPAENSFLFSSGEQSANIGFHNALLASQTFVFQEPDPPRIG